jgi:hypothetical protein
MTTQTRKVLSWLAILCSAICSIALRFSAVAAIQHAMAADEHTIEEPAKSAEISAFYK